MNFIFSGVIGVHVRAVYMRRRVNFRFVPSELYFSSVIGVPVWTLYMRRTVNFRFVPSALYSLSVIGSCICDEK